MKKGACSLSVGGRTACSGRRRTDQSEALESAQFIAASRIAVLRLGVLACVLTLGCRPDAPKSPETTPTDPWTALLQEEPYPYAGALPPHQPTDLDGTYTKIDPRLEGRAGCRRCPPYPPEGGLWKLRLDKGVFWVFHERTTWQTQGSFSVKGDKIEFFNDPQCHKELGSYGWKLEAGHLLLEVIDDECGFGLRTKALTAQPWLTCQPFSMEAAITDHWQMPPGCD